MLLNAAAINRSALNGATPVETLISIAASQAQFGVMDASRTVTGGITTSQAHCAIAGAARAVTLDGVSSQHQVVAGYLELATEATLASAQAQDTLATSYAVNSVSSAQVQTGQAQARLQITGGVISAQGQAHATATQRSISGSCALSQTQTSTSITARTLFGGGAESHQAQIGQVQAGRYVLAEQRGSQGQGTFAKLVSSLAAEGASHQVQSLASVLWRRLDGAGSGAQGQTLRVIFDRWQGDSIDCSQAQQLTAHATLLSGGRASNYVRVPPTSNRAAVLRASNRAAVQAASNRAVV